MARGGSTSNNGRTTPGDVTTTGTDASRGGGERLKDFDEGSQVFFSTRIIVHHLRSPSLRRKVDHDPEEAIEADWDQYNLWPRAIANSQFIFGERLYDEVLSMQPVATAKPAEARDTLTPETTKQQEQPATQ